MSISFNYRHLWLAMAITCFTLAVSSLVLTDLLNLHPCYLCVFQRLLYLVIASFALIIWLAKINITSLIFNILIWLCAAYGTSIASYHVWLQAQPGAEFACSGGDPNMLEIIVMWLSKLVPMLFLATGNCASKELVILGLSLAGWSLVGFIVCLLLTSWMLWHNWHSLKTSS